MASQPYNIVFEFQQGGVPNSPFLYESSRNPIKPTGSECSVIERIEKKVFKTESENERAMSENERIRSKVYRLDAENKSLRLENQELKSQILELKTQNNLLQKSYDAVIKTFAKEKLEPIKKQTQTQQTTIKLTIQHDNSGTLPNQFDTIIASVPILEWKQTTVSTADGYFTLKHHGQRCSGLPSGKGLIWLDDKIFDADFETCDTEDGIVIECKQQGNKGRFGKVYYKGGDVFTGTLRSSKQLLSIAKGELKVIREGLLKEVLIGEWDSNGIFRPQPG